MSAFIPRAPVVQPSTYTLPLASDSILGGVKVGTSLEIDGNGVLDIEASLLGDTMLKSVYDTDDDGIVDAAERISLEVTNRTGSSIAKGKVVYLSGAQGNRPKILLAKADAEATSSLTIGVVEADINHGENGYVTLSGKLHNIDTSAFVDGDLLYLSASTAGGYTTVKPVAPNHSVVVATVAYSHATNGVLAVHVNNGHEITELHDVLISAPSDGQILVYEASTGLWKNLSSITLSTLKITDNLVMSKTSGEGIKVDPSSPSFGWKDLIGDITPKTSGVGSPTLDTITGNIRGFRYSVGDDGDAVYHLPHDYLPGSNLYLHPHWTHNGTNISGSLVIDVYITYAKGHQQASFHSQKTLTITDGSLSIVNTPALWHRIPEVQLSTSGGSASQLDTDILEVDGIIIMHYDVSTIPTITGGSGEPFLITFDIHYQSTNMTTKQKAPDFYT
jgi:hypothetical protein